MLYQNYFLLINLGPKYGLEFTPDMCKDVYNKRSLSNIYVCIWYYAMVSIWTRIVFLLLSNLFVSFWYRCNFLGKIRFVVPFLNVHKSNTKYTKCTCIVSLPSLSYQLSFIVTTRILSVVFCMQCRYYELVQYHLDINV